MDKQSIKLFEKELLTVWRLLDLDRLLTLDENGEYVDMGTRSAYHFWQVATKQVREKYQSKIGEIEGLNVAAVLLLKENESKIKRLQAEIEQLKNLNYQLDA